LARLAAGVNVATKPEYETAPLTAVPPGPVTVKVDVPIVVGFIASLKVAFSTWPTGTLVAPFPGTVAVTAGAGVIVVKVQT
jgi:hypothetical protein